MQLRIARRSYDHCKRIILRLHIAKCSFMADFAEMIGNYEIIPCQLQIADHILQMLRLDMREHTFIYAGYNCQTKIGKMAIKAFAQAYVAYAAYNKHPLRLQFCSNMRLRLLLMPHNRLIGRNFAFNQIPVLLRLQTDGMAVADLPSIMTEF